MLYYDSGKRQYHTVYRVSEWDTQCDTLCLLCYMIFRREPVCTQTALIPFIFLVDITCLHK